MATRVRGNRRTSCPEGWVPAGAKAPLHLTVRQEQYCRQALGIARFCYNLAVATHQFCRANHLPWPSWQDIYKAFNQCKREDYPFVSEVASRVAEGAFMDFGKAVANWDNADLKARRPQFKKRKRTGTGSFRAASGVAQIKYNGKRRIQLPGLGSVKLDCTLPKGIYHEAHIRSENGRWYICLKRWKAPQPTLEPDCRTSGAVDTGINPHATDSDGQTYENPKAYYQVKNKLARWQRAQARRKTGSRWWWEAQRRIDKRHRSINGLRQNAIHQLTNSPTGKYRDLVVEALNIAGMMRGTTPLTQGDAAMGEITRQLKYKAEWRNTTLVQASRTFPSSKTCSVCRYVNAKLKRERYWSCPNCGARHERNANAARNLLNLVTPPGRGEALRDGKALARGITAGETGPNDRRTAPSLYEETKLTV